MSKDLIHKIKIQKTKDVWIAWTNTDCTEGRGRQIPLAVCATKSTAIRLGKEGYIQGGNCPVKKGIAVRIDDQWLTPGYIQEANDQDVTTQKRIDEKFAVLKKAKAAGLTKIDLKILSGDN